jgi:hypothetical protein
MTLEHDLLQLASDAMRSLMNGREFATGQTGHYLNIIRRIEDELNRPKPDPIIVPFPSFMRKRIEEAIDLAINPKGMSVHDGKAMVYASDLQRMIAVIDLAPPRKEWVGLTINEVWDVYEEDNYDAVRFARAIESKLKELNK